MQRLTLATTPWSQVVSSTVDIWETPIAMASPFVVMSTISSPTSIPASKEKLVIMRWIVWRFPLWAKKKKKKKTYQNATAQESWVLPRR